MTYHLISIVIPTFNEERNIDRCLSSIFENGYPKIEVIVVDQGSTDKTAEIVQAKGARLVRMPRGPRKMYLPPSASRNRGFEQSRGNIIYHLDADMELEAGLLAEINEHFTNPRTVALVIPETDRPQNFWARGKALERSLYKNTFMEAARVARRDVFGNIRYDTAITSGEDWNIHREYERVGNVARTKKGVWHHLGSISLTRELEKKLHYGTGSGNYISRNQKGLVWMMVRLMPLYLVGIIRNAIFDPLGVVAFFGVRTVDVVGLILGVLRSKKPVIQ